MAREADTYGLGATQFIVAPGATLALLVTAEAWECGSGIKYFTGGSLEIQPAPPYQGGFGYSGGATWAGASLVNLIGKGYLMGTTEAISISGPARYYLMATGATVTCFKLVSYSAGN